jgi:hypothetical protein
MTEKEREISELMEKGKTLWDESQILTQRYGKDDQITIDKRFQWYEISVHLEELGIIL